VTADESFSEDILNSAHS